MNLLAERTPIPNGLIVFVTLGLAADVLPWPLLSMSCALGALLTLPAWWRTHRRREARIRAVRERVACEPLRVGQMEWPW